MSAFNHYDIDHIELFVPMAKPLAYWHVHALGFRIIAQSGPESGNPGISSYCLASGDVRLVLTAVYPTRNTPVNVEISSFVAQYYCGVKRVALRVPDVQEAYDNCLRNGGIPVRPPVVSSDGDGSITEAAIKLYDNSEIVFISRQGYKGIFKPGYRAAAATNGTEKSFFRTVDHVASELRINEIDYWTKYLSHAVGTSLVQNIERGEDNRTGMVLNINQSADRLLTLVMAEPDGKNSNSRVQQNIDIYGPGIHHLAFTTADLPATVRQLRENGVEFVGAPASYYDLLRSNEEMTGLDIDALEELGILVDKEDDTYLLQKFIKPISDRPFFFYEIVQRVNGYSGFALKNINVLKKAEELEIQRVAAL